MVEVQEPTDLSVLLEWDGFELTEDEGHLDLGWDTALRSARPLRLGRAARGRAARPGRRAARCCRPPPTRGSGPSGCAAATSSTRASRSSSGSRATASSAACRSRRGTALLVPFDAGPLTLSGDVEAIRCRPPDPAVAA